MKAECQTNPSGLRFGLITIIILMVITSSIVLLVNPSLAKTASTPSTLPTISTIPSAPSTIGQDASDSDFTTQAALTGVSARQTNNIVGTQSYYDVVFTTSTTGTIKFIDITFPAGILIGAAPQLAEREGIGAGTAAKTSNTEIRYTVTSAVSVPAGTKIRLEFFNLVNPTVPSNIYKVTVTTRTAGGTTIDGPTSSNSLNIKQIGTDQIADGAVTAGKIPNGAITKPKISPGAVSLQVIQRTGQSVDVPPGGALATSIAGCLAGETLVGGGHGFSGINADFHYLVSFINTIDGQRVWRVSAINEGTQPMTLTAVAECAPSLT